MSKDVLSQMPSHSTPTTAANNAPKLNVCAHAVAMPLGLVALPDANMQKIYQVIKKVATTNACILIVGEVGTGKKTLGQLVHHLSNRAAEATVVNISEMERDSQVGQLLDAINDAAGSTVIIENIDKLTETAQIQFNAILKNQITLPKPTRIVVTTEADLAQAIRSGSFFKELYYRLNVIRLEVPALRQRKSDILPLAQHFLTQLTNNQACRFTMMAEQAILKHGWSGNLQELRNIIKRACLLASGPEISHENLEIGTILTEDNHWVDHLPVGSTLKEVETKFILKTISHHNGNRTHSAKTLGISLRTLRNKINEFQIEGLDVAEPTKGRALA